MDMNKTTLVVVDVQNGFIREPSRPVVPVIAEFTERWQAAGGATVFSRFINTPDSAFARMIQWTKVQESPEIDIVDELTAAASRATAVIDKPGYTVFSPEGVEIFGRGGWTDLLICGIATESCVCKTAVDAFELGYTPWVLTDASASHAGQEAQDAGMLVIRRFIGAGQMITTRDVRIPIRQPTLAG